VAATALLALPALASCGGSSSPSPPPSSPGSGNSGSADIIQITGRERLGWSQAANDITTLHFAVYVDNNRVDLPSATCQTAATSGTFDCESPLPPLTPGPHALEMVAVLTTNGQTVESPRAAPLNVNVTGGNATIDVATSLHAPSAARSSSAHQVTPGCGLASLSPAAFAMWDNLGEIRVTDTQSGASHALTWKTDPEWTLTAIAAHPKFAANHQLYTAETSGSGRMLRLSRYREVGGVLGERAVLMQTPLDASAGRTWMSFGAGGDLYVALLAPADVNSPTSEHFLIHVTDAGLPVRGNAAGSVFAPVSAPIPVAMAWAPDSSVPWTLTRVSPDEYIVTQLGQPQTVDHRLYTSSPPIAMQIATIDSQQTMFVTGNRSDVRRLARDDGAWSLRDGFRLSDSAQPIRDALILATSEIAACGPVGGSRYGVWRVRLP
jgi:hypothetical protein